MAISITRYIDITSGVGAGAVVPTRELIGRFFTANPLLPPQTMIEFESAADVAAYFGFTSEEYFRSLFYFSWISKNFTTPQAIQFARWVQTAAAPMIFPVPGETPSLSAWNAISSGSFILTMAGLTHTLSSLDFSAAGSLAAVATDVQNAINAAGSSVLAGTTHTSTSVTGISDTSTLAVGMSVIAADIPFGTTIAVINSGTAITLSQAATGSNVGENVTFNNGVWGNAVVNYSSSYGAFILTGGAADVVANPVNVQAGGGGTNITPVGLLGWLPEITYNADGSYLPGAIFASGSAVETVTQTLTNSVAASNNFGSFAFLTNLNVTQQNVVDAATWNKTQNVLFVYSQAVTPANATAWASAIATIGGVGLTLSPVLSFSQIGTLASGMNTVTGLVSNANMFPGMPITDADTYLPAGTIITSLVGSTGLTLSNNATGSASELLTFYTLQFPEQIPMMIEAATNYLGVNAVQNYEFQQFANAFITPSVSSDAVADGYDGIRVNYYGQTQTAGQPISFYQRGVLMGLPTDPLDMNVYANEQWLKDAATAAIMTLLLSLNQVPANNQGRSQILAVLQSVINQALNNGTISVGKTLTAVQILAITQITNDPNAYYQIQTAGYWVDCVIVATGSNPVVYTANYTLVYSKDDVIRQVTGSHVLI